MDKKINIAIDGPSGAGKSTLAKKIAKHLGYIYVDTGALYRAIGYYVLQQDISTKDIEKVSALLKDIKVYFNYIDDVQHVYVNEDDVTDFIRTQPVSMAASDVSAIPEVREFLLQTQRTIAEKENIVMDGRDVGTVILPNADIKIFLTATAEDRARRRHEEMILRGNPSDYKTILKEINERDYNDSNRAIAPLKQADDAILFDNSGMEEEQTFNGAMEIINSALK